MRRFLLVLAVLLVVPAQASAATLTRSGGVLRFTGGPGEGNYASVLQSFSRHGLGAAIAGRSVRRRDRAGPHRRLRTAATRRAA